MSEPPFTEQDWILLLVGSGKDLLKSRPAMFPTEKRKL